MTNVLIISGDKTFGPGNSRYELQRRAVDVLEVVYWGRGSVWPRIPEGHFDVVTVQDPFMRGLFGWCVARRLRVPLNVQVHTDLFSSDFFVPNKPLLTPLFLILARFVLRRADSVRVVSERIKVSLASLRLSASVTMLPVFVDGEAIRSYSPLSKMGVGPSILAIARLEPEKNIHGTLIAFKEIQKAFLDASLSIYGDGSEKESLQEYARSLGLEQNVFFRGHTDVRGVYATADLLLVTSWYEGFGAAIIEALAAGCPVVAPDVGVAKEAGAVVVSRAEIAVAAIDVLKKGMRGTLTIPLLDASAWTAAWKKSLGATH